ncbi:MAG: hypothetical protein U0235_19040 [Polyangiaceae bacterium]
MAAKAWATAHDKDSKDKKAVDELFVSNQAVSLCLLVNRRAKTMRVIDFRAGPSEAKRKFVHALAKREGVEKMYTLVERDEVGTWAKLGFVKEGNIPGFYKRSDAFMLGCVPSTYVPPSEAVESQTRISVAPKKSRIEMARLAMPDLDLAPPPPPDLSDDDDDTGPVDTRAHDLAEKTLVHAKKRAKELATKPAVSAKVAMISEAEAKKSVAAGLRAGRALTAFEPFGRDFERRFFSVTARGGFELVASTESQSCFGNAFLELLTAPKNDAEKVTYSAALGALLSKLIADGVASCFALCPSDDVAMATTMVANGFRRTGLLQSHLIVGSERKDAMIFSRKLANPADE